MGMTSDCRYSLPVGFTAIPDVACAISFTSEEIQTTKEFDKSLSTSVDVSFGGFGLHFSASTAYKHASSELSSANSVFVISKATCNTYFVKMDMTKPPLLQRGFLEWSARVAASDNEEEVLRFLDYYGTHFAPEVVFGARYIYKHVMSSSDYKKMSTSGLSVSVRASYSGLISVGADFNLDSNQKNAASEFSQKVQTTTITAGAPPPAKGDAMTWASAVKDFPVPSKYTLESLDQLFSDRFIQGIQERQDIPFNHKIVSEKIRDALESKRYYNYLMGNKEVDYCETISGEIKMSNINLSPITGGRWGSLETCKDACLRESGCVAISYRTEPNVDTPCILLGHTLNLQESNEWESFIFTSKLRTTRTNLVVRNVEVTGRVILNAAEVGNMVECEKRCKEDVRCDLFWFCMTENPRCHPRHTNCELYTLSRDTHQKFCLKISTDLGESMLTFVARGD